MNSIKRLDKRFGKGPAIGIHFHLEKGSIASTTLVLADTFTCTNATPALLVWLDRYLHGFHDPLPLVTASTFQSRALCALQTIPFGQTISYRELATLAGNPKASRAAGGACHRNPFPLLIPCHRIIRADGSLGGFALDMEIKRRLLGFEASLFRPAS